MPRRAKSHDATESDGLADAVQGRAFWSGTISFGLVSIPVELFPATRTTRSALRMLTESGTPIARRYVTTEGKPIDPAELTRGYEVSRDSFVLITDDELDALLPEQSRDINLSRFVDRSAIPVLLFERPYILAPSGKSTVAYRLLASTLERRSKAGIATFVMRGKQYVIAIFADDGLLRAETLRFPEELRTPASIGLPSPVAVAPAKVKAMKAAIDRQTTKAALPESDLADGYEERLAALVEEKLKDRTAVVQAAAIESEETLADVIDLVAVLKQSLARKPSDPADSKHANNRSAHATTPRKKVSARAGHRAKP